MQILRTLSFDLLAAYPYAALSIGTAIALETNVALLYPRKEFKAYGTGKRIEEQWQPDQRAVLFEDLITSVPTPCFPFALLAPLAVRFFFHRKDAKGAKIWGSFLFFAFFAVKS